MKKIAIAGASVALAAMPIVGVFAVDGDSLTPITDTVTVTVANSCTFARRAGGGTYDAGTIANGSASSDITGSVFNIKCNDTGGWYLTAAGDSDATTKSSMDSSTSKDTDDIVTGTTFSGDTSAWAFRLDGTGVISDYSAAAYANVPAAGGATVATSNTAAGNGTGIDITAHYKVYIGNNQAAGTYTGKVTYTLAHPAVTTQS